MPKISRPAWYIFDFKIDNLLQAYTVVKGVEVPLNNMGITARRALGTNPMMNRVGWIELVNPSSSSNPATADRPRIDTLYQYIEDYSYTSNNYRDIKTSQLWKDVYDIKQGAIFHWDKKTAATQKWTECGFCLGTCGFYLPLRVLTIDHQRAQSLTGLEVLMRMFRGMGLTIGAPAGLKNKKMLTAWAAAVGGDTNLGRSKDKDDQNSLSKQGMLYYSIFKHLGVINELNDIAMHHFLNLRPMCGPCNSARGNQSTIVY